MPVDGVSRASCGLYGYPGSTLPRVSRWGRHVKHSTRTLAGHALPVVLFDDAAYAAFRAVLEEVRDGLLRRERPAVRRPLA